GGDAVRVPLREDDRPSRYRALRARRDAAVRLSGLAAPGRDVDRPEPHVFTAAHRFEQPVDVALRYAGGNDERTELLERQLVKPHAGRRASAHERSSHVAADVEQAPS